MLFNRSRGKNKQSTLSLIYSTQNKTMTYDIGNPGPGMNWPRRLRGDDPNVKY